jgi:DNA transformation protein
VKVSRDFVDYLQDLFGQLGQVRVRAMFGGAGVYIDDLMFGLLDRDETLYLRTDDENRAAFEAAGSAPFRYPLPSGEEMGLGYWRMPDDALDSSEIAVGWGRLALEAAMRKKANKGRKRS